MRIALVNDMKIAVEILRRVVCSSPAHEVAWIAYDGAQAVEKCAHDKPDLILMDLIMPVMDGVQATCAITRQNPCPILVVTATVSGNAAKVFEAMGCGALDVVATPVFGPGGEIRGGEELLKKISLIGRLAGADRDAKNAGLRTQSPAGPASLPPLVVIGSSTGGPKALVAVLSRLPAALGAPVVIVQHVDVQFAHGLAEWLSEQTPLPVTLAREGARPETNTVYLAATSDHLVLGPECAFRYTPEPQDYPYKPSVDVLFRSVERHWRTRGVAVLLTGMGRDGAKGLLSLHRAGWHTIAQDEGSSIVYGMPRAAAELGGARQVLPVEKIADAIIRELQKGKPGNVFA